MDGLDEAVKGGAIGGAEELGPKETQLTGGIQAIAHVCELRGKAWRSGVIVRKLGQNGGAICAADEIFARGLQLEVGVQFPGAADAILAGSENHQISRGGNGVRGQLPAPAIGGIVHKQSTDLKTESVGIMKFNPIRGVPVLILKPGGIGGEELRQLRWCQNFIHAHQTVDETLPAVLPAVRR